MGQPLSVITTLFVFSAVIHANCVDKKATQEEKCGENKTKPECAAKAEWCWWRGDDGYVPEPLSDSYSNVRTTTAADGTLRLEKDLPPLEAITEYIGDLVYYEQLRKHMPWATVYDGVLEKLTLDEVTITRAKDFNTEMPDEESAIIPLLTFSRPMLETKALIVDGPKVSIPLKALTLNNIVSIAHIAWWDALTMNNDRFSFDHDRLFRHNRNNMMVYEVPVADDASHPSFVYVPIDQGFARPFTTAWFKQKDPTAHYKQYQCTHDGWIHSYVPKDCSEWHSWYKSWLTEPISKAREFVTYNQDFFPYEIVDSLTRGKREEITNLITRIIHTIWTAKGVKLCEDMRKSISKFWGAVRKKRIGLLKDTAIDVQTKAGMAGIKGMIQQQITTCKEMFEDTKVSREEREKAQNYMEDIEGMLKTYPHVLLEQYMEDSKKMEAKQMQYDDALYLDIDSNDVNEDGERYDYAYSHSLQSGHWNDFVVGGLFGASTIVVIVLVFCCGLACAMVSCWCYTQHNDLDQDQAEAVYWKESEEDA